MLLEYNLYDNFNPNVMERKREQVTSGTSFPSGYDTPKARGVLIDFECFQTGFEYTSSATLATGAAVGDIVEVLTTEDNSLAISPNTNISNKLSIWYVITTIDEKNKATLQNYFWYMIEGSAFPTKQITGTAQQAWTIIAGTSKKQLMYWDQMANWDETNITLKFNMKAETVEIKEFAKDLFSKLQLEPITFSYNLWGTKRPGLQQGLLTDEWKRQQKVTRIDDNNNPAIEKVVVTERSNYNYAKVFIKVPNTSYYPTDSIDYTINDSGNLVKLSDYTGDGFDLPEQRIIKTLFYDETPTDAQIKSEVAQDSVLSKIYFNNNPLYPLQVNDLVKIWYNGVEYNGHIADRSFTSLGIDRLTFMEGNRG